MNVNSQSIPLDRWASLFSRRFEGEGMFLQSVKGVESITGVPAACSRVFTRIASEISAANQRLGASDSVLDLRRHPVIELRTCDQYVTLELVISPEAWFDQHNLLGKLSVQRHRSDLQALLQQLNPDMKLGAWSGTALSDEHLEARHFHISRVFNVWANTFIDGRDWVRIGRWIPLEDVSEDTPNQLFHDARQLYKLFRFIAWNSRNDFQTLYQRQVAKSF
jgi:hypothetical protein